MTEGMEWGTWKWLLEKARVQEIADVATAELDEADRKAKSKWNDELKRAYKMLSDEQTSKRHRKEPQESNNADVTTQARAAAEKVKAAYEQGQRARRKAEHTFEQAEQRMSAELAREGARQALESYDLRERAIRMAEAVER